MSVFSFLKKSPEPEGERRANSIIRMIYIIIGKLLKKCLINNFRSFCHGTSSTWFSYYFQIFSERYQAIKH